MKSAHQSVADLVIELRRLRRYYDAYLAFFAAELAAKGPRGVLEEYVFSTAANHPEGGKQVEMLNRFTDGVIHPLIHVGYGYELGIPGMIVEGDLIPSLCLRCQH